MPTVAPMGQFWLFKASVGSLLLSYPTMNPSSCFGSTWNWRKSMLSTASGLNLGRGLGFGEHHCHLPGPNPPSSPFMSSSPSLLADIPQQIISCLQCAPVVSAAHQLWGLSFMTGVGVGWKREAMRVVMGLDVWKGGWFWQQKFLLNLNPPSQTQSCSMNPCRPMPAISLAQVQVDPSAPWNHTISFLNL